MLQKGQAPQTLDAMLPNSQIELDISAPPPSAADAFLAWEKMRLAYNIILVIVALCILDWTVLLSSLSWLYLAQYVFVANLCFCAVPWIEGWGAIAGANRSAVRWLLFVPGTILACVLAAGALYSLPTWP
jgi:hypothetical protein